MKKIIVLTTLIILIPLAWWLLSPLFINVEVNEKLPTITKEEHDRQNGFR